MTLTELKKIAKEKNLTGYSTLKKVELIELINK
ncbi:MAG: Rho termination factor N-terminal domain-containing protein [Bacilli bacterium]